MKTRRQVHFQDSRQLLICLQNYKNFSYVVRIIMLTRDYFLELIIKKWVIKWIASVGLSKAERSG